MPLSAVRHILWKFLEECHRTRDPFAHFARCIESLRAEALATEAEINAIEETGLKVLTLIYGGNPRD
jgi:hypothetical protein